MTQRRRGLLLLSLLLLALGAACQDDYLVPPQAGAAPPGTAAPQPPDPPEPEPPRPPEPSTPFEPPPGAFTLQETRDWGCDGSPEEYAWSTYDADGQLLYQERRYEDGDSGPGRCELVWHDPDGGMRRAEDEGCAGMPMRCVRNLVTEHVSIEENDLDCDGQPENRFMTELDPQRRLRSVYREEMLGSSSATCSRWLYSDDAAGEPLESSYDVGCDGVLEHCRVPLLDAEGRKIGAVEDELCDGDYERCELNTLGGLDSILATPEGAGCLGASLSCILREQRDDPRGVRRLTTYDEDCDGTPERCLQQLYSPEGELLYDASDHGCDGVNEHAYCQELAVEATDDTLTTTLSADYGCDGRPEECSRRVERSGPDGKLVELTEGCEGEAVTCAANTFDAAGRELESWSGCGEIKESCVSRRYDAAGNLIHEVYSDSCAPIGDRCNTRSYDAAGNLTYEETDANCNGRPERCTRNTWDPRGPLLSATTAEDCHGSPELCFKATPYP